ncbi:hypothetical protein [Arenimonas sp. MALMAid1274]|uniref:hypothetical protein n=1 Tax=Arenimonas sp. MALMAid1274 TaxID=3411630 RepID=UPI003B9F2DE4
MGEAILGLGLLLALGTVLALVVRARRPRAARKQDGRGDDISPLWVIGGGDTGGGRGKHADHGHDASDGGGDGGGGGGGGGD